MGLAKGANSRVGSSRWHLTLQNEINDGGYMPLNLKVNRRAQLIFKIIGSIVFLTGIFLVAKYHLHLVGLILIVVGIYFAVLLGHNA